MTDNEDPPPKRHRHERSSWIICGGRAIWCYQCGAWRAIQWSEGNPAEAVGPWEKPTGVGGPNPAMSPTP